MGSIEWQHLVMVLVGVIVYVALALRVRSLYKRTDEVVDLLEDLTDNVKHGIELLEEAHEHEQ